MARVAVVAAAVVAVASLSACEPSYTVKDTKVTLAVPCGGTTTVDARWAFPEGVTPTGMIWLQHGFARSGDNVADLMRRYSARGYVVVAPSFSAFGGCAINAAALHAAVASLIAGSPSPTSALQVSANAARSALGLPAVTLPTNIVLSGHSAGGAAMTAVGGALASNPDPAVSSRLKGVVLLDPVENADNAMAANLPKLAALPVLTISGGDSSCNANSSGTKALLPTRTGFAGVRLPSGCHCDAEADTTDVLCTLVCGTPQQKNKDALRDLAVDWAHSMLKGSPVASVYPGGETYEQLLAAGTIVTLTGTAGG
ncbi:MAG: alpha/beta hydrolase [Actinobacteria bacterium]|nr:alpha/beta hydrolase [Actinomycetota bacterium]